MATDNSDWKKIGNNLTANREILTPTESVSRLAQELANEYQNPDYYKWYCSLIYKLGRQRITEIRGRAKDAQNPGRLFSKLAHEELDAKKARERFNA